MRPLARMSSFKGFRIIATILICYACINFQTDAAHLAGNNRSTDIDLRSHNGTGSHEKGDMVINALGRLAVTLHRIPWIGSLLFKFVDFILVFVGSFETVTNGALNTIIGGCLPCTVSLEYGVVCSGLYKNGGFLKLFMLSLDRMPTVVVPNIVKGMIGLVVEIMTDPSSDGFFSGIPIFKEIV